MTTKLAIEVLDEWREKLEGIAQEEMSLLEWHRDYLEPLEERLLNTDPFSKLKHAWIFSPDGGGRIVAGLVAGWTIEQFRLGASSEDIVHKASAQIEENVSHVLEITAVFGADTNQRVVLEDGLFILPASQVPDAWRAHNVQKNLRASIFEPGDCCVLVQQITVSPAFLQRSSLDEPTDQQPVQTSPESTARSEKRDLVRAAFILAGSSAIELAARTFLADDEQMLAGVGHRFGSLGGTYPPQTQQFDDAQIRTTFCALSGFSEKEALLRAIDRLGRSRSNAAIADQALDLGIAAEIVLMHGSSDSNAEITNKLQSERLGCSERPLTSAWKPLAQRKHSIALARKSRTPAASGTRTNSTVLGPIAF